MKPTFLTFAIAALLAGANPAAAQDFPGWTRSQEGQRLVSSMPDLTLEVAAGFTPLEPLVFPIGNMTWAERRIFVHAGDDGRITRMVVVQYEHAQDDSDFRFVFPPRPPREFGGQTWRSGTFMSDEARSIADPDREPARTHRFLAGKGYVLPAYWDIARLARVSDGDGLTEVIIFYMEASEGPAAGMEVDPEDGSAELTPDRTAQMWKQLESAIRPVAG